MSSIRAHDDPGRILAYLREVPWDDLAQMARESQGTLRKEETKEFDYMARNILYVVSALKDARYRHPPDVCSIDAGGVTFTDAYGADRPLPTYYAINEKIESLEHWFPLHQAIAEHKPEHVQMLLLTGADPMLTNRDGDDAFALAKKIGDKESVKALKKFQKQSKAMEHDAGEVLARAHGRGRGLALGHYKKAKGHWPPRAMPAVPAHRQDKEKSDDSEEEEEEKEESEESEDEESGEKEEKETLFAVAANTQKRTSDLFDAIRKGRLDRVKTMTVGEALSRDEKGRTPVMVALMHNQPEAARFLLANGADKKAKDARGLSVEDYMAANSKFEESTALEIAVKLIKLEK